MIPLPVSVDRGSAEIKRPFQYFKRFFCFPTCSYTVVLPSGCASCISMGKQNSENAHQQKHK